MMTLSRLGCKSYGRSLFASRCILNKSPQKLSNISCIQTDRHSTTSSSYQQKYIYQFKNLKLDRHFSQSNFKNSCAFSTVISQESYIEELPGKELKEELGLARAATMDQLGPMIALFTSTAVMGFAVSKVLNTFNLPFLWKNKVDTASPRHGGEIVAKVLQAHGVETVFTLVGGHISPILTASEKLGMRIIDTRHEATAVFAADASYRVSGIVGQYTFCFFLIM